jgi:hypothetical protein
LILREQIELLERAEAAVGSSILGYYAWESDLVRRSAKCLLTSLKLFQDG